jgi:hypothetical protein
MSARLLPFALVSLAALAGCEGRQLASASRSQLVPPQPAPAAPPAAPAAPGVVIGASGEQQLDTDTRSAPAAQPLPPPAKVAAPKRSSRAVRTPADEDLPRWVPVRGRLTVVESSDLAENLGLVPKGTTKKTDERISVADKLAEESPSRSAKSDPMTPGSSWSYAKPGRVKNHRF